MSSTAADLKNFVEYLMSCKKPLPDYLRYMLDFVKTVKDSNMPLEYNPNGLTETPPEILTLMAALKPNHDYIRASIDSLLSFKPVFGLASINEACEDLKSIRDTSTDKKISVDTYDRSITFNQAIVTEDVDRGVSFDFGVFKFKMLHDHVVCGGIAKNKKIGDSLHPYIRSGKVCLGTYLPEYKSAMHAMRFHVAYSLLIQCLSIYGGDQDNGTREGPYVGIANWIGNICGVCDTPFAIDTGTVCSTSGTSICNECVDSGVCADEVTGSIVLPALMKACTECGKKSTTCVRNTCISCRRKKILGVV